LFVVRVFSCRGLCDELFSLVEESYRLRCLVVCDLEASRMRRPWPVLGRSATGVKSLAFYRVIKSLSTLDHYSIKYTQKYFKQFLSRIMIT
jgi:hypothetical protein